MVFAVDESSTEPLSEPSINDCFSRCVYLYVHGRAV